MPGFLIPYGSGSTFVALGLLDSLEDNEIPEEAQHDATHERHLLSMRKFAQDEQPAARRRPLVIHLASFITAGAAQSKRLGEWLKSHQPPLALEMENAYCMLLSVLQKCMIILLREAGTSSNNVAFPPLYSKERLKKAGFIALDAYIEPASPAAV